MVDTIAADARPKALLARLIGVLTSPRATYADVVARPRSLGALLAVVAICAASLGGFLSTEVGREAAFDQQMRTMESFGRQLDDAQYARMKEVNGRPAIVALTVCSQAVVLTLMAALVAGIALAVFNLMDGDGTFRQTFAVVVHSGAVLALQYLFTMPLNYARQAMSSATNLAVFFPFLDENTFPARLLGSIDLFLIWWIVSVSIGFGVLYRRRTGPIAATLMTLYVLLAIVIAGVKSVLSAGA